MKKYEIIFELKFDERGKLYSLAENREDELAHYILVIINDFLKVGFKAAALKSDNAPTNRAS